ncbi:MAG TPA: ABC transporter ATP-binding protein [Bryobacteraceae bacterium]|jgi:ATP-binding cassette subfamily B protein
MKTAASTLWPYYKRYRRGMVLGFGSLALKDAFGAVQPLVIRAGIDTLTKTFAVETVVKFAGLLVLLSLCKGIFQYWMRVILIGISRDIEYDLRNDLFGKLVTLSSDFFARYRTGDIMARSTNDLNAVRMMLGPGVMYLFETGLTLIFAVAVMASTDWPLTLIGLAPAPLISIAVIYFGRRIHERFEVIQRMFSEISSRVQEHLAGVRVVRAYVQEKPEVEQFETMNKAYIGQNLRLALLTGTFNPMLQSLIGITFIVVLYVGGVRLLEHKITLGSFVMFNTYMGMLVWPMIAMGWIANLVQRGTASLDRIREILTQTPSIKAPAVAAPMPSPVRGEVELRNVSLEFASRAALRNLNLRIKAGSTVAIVGHTGSGKSSLISLIPRLQDPTSGTVLFDGMPLPSLDPEELRREIGVVPQETFLFSTTIAGNIAFGVKDATPDQIREAAEIAGLGPDIASFPNGLDTIIGERGITLSGGQKQRTAIARAVLRNPRLLILDDALSSVDTLTEESILQALARIMHGRTTILISHRVSTIRMADHIFVLEHGSIAEQGTHDELLRAGGYYADLYRRQLLEEELESI